MHRFESGKTMNPQTTFDFSVGLSGASVHGPLEPEARRSICKQCGSVSNIGKAFCSWKCVATHASFAAKRKALDKPNPITCGVCLCRVGFGLKVAQRMSGASYVSIRGRLLKSGGYAKLRVTNHGFRKQKPRKAGAFPESLSVFGVRCRVGGQHRQSMRTWRNSQDEVIESKRKKARDYYRRNRDKISAKLRANPYKRLKNAVRCRLYHKLRRTVWNKRHETSELIGCSFLHLRQHLESKFKDGMTWQNYGSWEVDHIVPCAAFDLNNKAERNACFHWSNLQPLWKSENRRKWAHTPLNESYQSLKIKTGLFAIDTMFTTTFKK